MINLQHLRTFLEVLRRGSFADAARALSYTPSAVSQQIAALEQELNLSLFERVGRGILPTAGSRLLAEHAVGLLERTAGLERDLGDVASGRMGQVHLGAFASAAAKLVPAALQDLRTRHPGAAVSMTEGEPDELIPELLAGELDAVVAYSYRLAPRRWPDTVVAERLMTEGMLLLIAAEHRLADAQPLDLALLRDESWISIRPGTEGDRAILGVCAAAGFQPRIAYRCNDFEVIRELVMANLGVAVVSSLGWRADPRLKATMIPESTRHRSVFMLRRRSTQSPLLDTMADCLRRAAHRHRRALARLQPTGEPAPS